MDDLHTIEHSKCKPLSITVAVDRHKRKILGLEVSRMPATGHLAKISRRKYGYRRDERPLGLKSLLGNVQQRVTPSVEITSDEHPLYPRWVKKFFPDGSYHRFKGEKACVSGQGELKKVMFDPLFSINHSFAMFRANINRLIRRTWCTTKDPKRLEDHLYIYANFHNKVLTP